MAIIYKITNLKNNKVYIGETIQTLQSRWNQHKSVSLNPNGHGHNYHLHNAIRKYGIENFIIEEIEECDDDIRFERETYYILVYESYNREKGYNYIIEGTGASPYSTKQILDLWNEGLKVKDIANKIKCHKGTISKRLHANGITHEEIIKRFSEYVSSRDSKPVEQYTLDGQYIKTFPSASSCQKEGYQESAISDVCNRKQKSAYNYLWKYAIDERDIKEWVEINKNKGQGGRPKKQVGQYDKETNELIQIFESAADAARFLDLKDKSCICRAARVEGTSHGFKWRYLDKC